MNRTATPLDVKENDIVIYMGYRCRATNVRIIPEEMFGDKFSARSNGPVARYTLNAAVNDAYPKPLPGGYNGGTYGGNKLARVVIES